MLTSEQVVPVCGLKEFVCLYLTARQPGGGLREEALYEVLGFIAGDDIIRERETVLEEEEIRVHVYKWYITCIEAHTFCTRTCTCTHVHD